MKRNYLLSATLLICMLVIIISCQEKPKDPPAVPEAPEAPAMPEISEVYTVDEALNPLNVYGDQTKVLADTLNVQFYELILEPGDSIGLHAHLDHTTYVLEGGDVTLWVGGKEKKEMTIEAGTGWFGGPLTDAAKNSGDTKIRILITEIFRPRMQ